MSAYNEQRISMLEKEVNDLKEEILKIQKNMQKDEKKNIHDIRDIFKEMQDQKEKINVFVTWKEWIDKIIEKIKKLLPIW